LNRKRILTPCGLLKRGSMSGEIEATFGVDPGNGGEIVFAKTGPGRIAITNKKSGAAIEFDLALLMNLDWENLRQIRRTLASPALRLYHTTGDAHTALLTARKMFKRWPNVISVNNYVGFAFKIEKERPE